MRERVLQLIYDVLKQLGADNGTGGDVFGPDTTLFGKGSHIDSLGLVNLIVMTEEKVDEVFGVALTLADERAMSMERSPFRNVNAFADYIETLLREAAIE